MLQGKKDVAVVIKVTNQQTSLVAQMVKRLPTMWETQVRSLGWEDPLEKEMGTHSSILAWKIPWTEETGMLYNLQDYITITYPA